MALNGVFTLPVLLVDDEPQLLHSVSVVLRSAGMTQVLTQSDSREVLPMLAEHEVGVLVLDLTMPHLPGSALLERIATDYPDVPVLVLTVHPEDQYAVRCIKAGAAGFLTKESAPDKLIEAVRKVAGGGRWVSPELAETLASVLAGASPGAPHERLSDREFEIFKMLGSGKTVSQIALHLALSVKTVSTHRARILKKMSLQTNAELTHYAMRNHLVD